MLADNLQMFCRKTEKLVTCHSKVNC